MIDKEILDEFVAEIQEIRNITLNNLEKYVMVIPCLNLFLSPTLYFHDLHKAKILIVQEHIKIFHFYIFIAF